MTIRLPLTPAVDRPPGSGFISFENGDELLISAMARGESMKKMGVLTDRIVNVGSFAEPSPDN